MNFTVLYTAAHAGFPETEPLGGGKAVADYLIREWRVGRPGFELEVLSPRATGALPATPLTELSVWGYARFCRAFERAVTERILAREAAGCVVLANDVSEGPDFATLGRRGYRVVTIFHVDVVEYFTKFYLREWVRVETAAQWGRYRWLPDVLRLVFVKQADCVRWSRRLVVPSDAMREVIERCYGREAARKVVVVPWGNVVAADSADSLPVPVAEEDVVVVAMSRLSPEKGIERVLKALRWMQRKEGYRMWICGAAAYMQGRRYERRLRRLAEGLPVEFLGHVTGARKAAVWQRADVFVSPSRHESYGLTIAEAEAAGCRVISHSHYGARGRVVDCEDVRALAEALQEEIERGRTVKRPVATKSDAADRLAEIMREVAREG